MDDLIERLRAASHDERLSTGMLYREAADEIDRLRRELAEARELLRECRHWLHSRYACNKLKMEDRELIVARIDATAAPEPDSTPE